MLSGIANYIWGAEEEGDDVPTTQPQTSDNVRLRLRDAEDDWELVDKSRGNSPLRLGQHPMENLLIEHPSMSVYGLRGRQHSVGVDSEHSESSTEGATTRAAAAAARRAGASRRVAHPPHRPRAVAARAGLASPAQTVRSMQKSQKRQESHRLSRGHMERQNQLQTRKTKGRQQHQYYLRHSGRNNDRKICY